MRALLVVLALAASAQELAAQALRPALGASVVAARVRSERLDGTDQLSGTTFGGDGAVSLGRFALNVSYLQGTLQTTDGAASRDIIEGRALLGVRPFSWLNVAGGAHARTYVLPSGRTERWVLWAVRARGEGAFIGSAVTGYAELWRALSADVNVPEPFDHAHGGEAGIVVHFSRAPMQARVAYRIDHAVLGGGARLETVEGVVVGLNLIRR